MSDLDLTEAVEAAASGAYADAPGAGPEWDDLPSTYRREVRELVLGFLNHATPVIEAQVRARIAAQIEAYADAMHDIVDTPNGVRLAFEAVAAIARGES